MGLNFSGIKRGSATRIATKTHWPKKLTPKVSQRVLSLSNTASRASTGRLPTAFFHASGLPRWRPNITRPTPARKLAWGGSINKVVMSTGAWKNSPREDGGIQGRLPWLPLVSYRSGQNPTRGRATLRAYWQGLGGRIAISYQSRLIATCTVAQVRQARKTIMEHRAQAVVARLVKSGGLTAG